MDAATREEIQSQYPAFAYLLDNPEIGPLLERAITEGWPEGRFISSLYATNWYRTRSETGRQLETLRALDPAEAARREYTQMSSVRDMVGQLGLNMSWEEMQFIAADELGRGAKPSDPEEKIFFLNWVRANPSRVSNTGTIYQNAQMVDDMYRREFFYAGLWEDQIRVGVELALGYQTAENVRANAAEWFSSVTPHLATRLRAGESYADIVNPYRDIVAKELELGGLDAVDMVGTNEWKWLLGKADDTSGEVRLPTQQEVISGARKDPRWNKTIGATSLGTNLVTEMTRKFGTTA